MVDGDCQGTVPIHLGHFKEKGRSMVRSPSQDIVLPLMNHFVRQRVHDFLDAILARLVGLLEQGKREANFAFGGRASTVMIRP
jgi:hypothetical protein